VFSCGHPSFEFEHFYVFLNQVQVYFQSVAGDLFGDKVASGEVEACGSKGKFK
jgi:hypothetical protein